MHACQASEDDLQWLPVFKQVTLNLIKYNKENKQFTRDNSLFYVHGLD